MPDSVRSAGWFLHFSNLISSKKNLIFRISFPRKKKKLSKWDWGLLLFFGGRRRRGVTVQLFGARQSWEMLCWDAVPRGASPAGRAACELRAGIGRERKSSAQTWFLIPPSIPVLSPTAWSVSGEHIPPRIPASPPRLQGFFSPPLLFNYIQGSFSAFAIPLIAFRADISSGVNSIGVPAMVRRDGEFIWMLLIPLSILWVPSCFKQGSNFYFVRRVETSRINHTLERNRW